MILTLFESVQKAYTRPSQIISADWPEIAELLTTKQPANSKEDVLLFNLWEFDLNGEPGRRRIYENGEPTEKQEEVQGTIRRCKANGRFLHGLVLDFDELKSINQAMGDYSAFENVIYSTFRNTQAKNKFRVVLPFIRPLSSAAFHKKKKAISATFQGVDSASFSESQSFYLHSGAVPFTNWNKGAFLDPNWFEDEEILPVPELKRNSGNSVDRNAYKESLIDSLATCSGLHYNGPHKYNVLTLVALCKSADITFDEFDILCRNMMAADSSLANDNLRKSAWLNWKPHSGITAKVREEFIADHGGTSKFGQKQEAPIIQFRSTKEIAAYVRAKYKTENK